MSYNEDNKEWIQEIEDTDFDFERRLIPMFILEKAKQLVMETENEEMKGY